MGYLTENDAEIYVTTWMKFEELEASTDGSKPKRDGKVNYALVLGTVDDRNVSIEDYKTNMRQLVWPRTVVHVRMINKA